MTYLTHPYEMLSQLSCVWYSIEHCMKMAVQKKCKHIKFVYVVIFCTIPLITGRGEWHVVFKQSSRWHTSRSSQHQDHYSGIIQFIQVIPTHLMIGHRQTLSLPTNSPSSNDDVVIFKGFRRGTVKQSHDYKFGILENYHCCRVGDFTALVWCGVSKLEWKFCSALESTWGMFEGCE